ncbi:peptidyl-prolyl cis-trans isomerase [Paenibacillus tengchongensis]|uniref:peptidyl-prolyl cis-trans isomerase n=1 Tax=Paenibacillus tengchongensis TaxID=2608684 RepID=UPI001652751A|nr:peptidyl-prolyl cis-trans isomerase [Paenibacillus tengchongensis]
MTRQERALRNAVILLAAAALVLGGLLIWSLRAVATFKEDAAEGESPEVAAADGQPVTDEEWTRELKKKHGDEVLLGILNHIVVGKEAAALGIQVTEEDIDRELERSMAGYASEEQYYAQMLSELGLSRQEVREEVGYHLTLQAVATAGIHISDAEIDAYLDENAERFMPAKQVQLSIIRTENYEQADEVMDRLEQGEDFAALAREVSIDEESREHGGRIGTVEENDPFWPEDLLKTAVELDAGDIAGPLQTGDDYTVLRVENIIVPEPPEPAEIREEVRKELALAQAAPLEQVESDLRRKYDTAIYIDNSMQD